VREILGLLTVLATRYFPMAVQAQQPIRVNCAGPATPTQKGSCGKRMRAFPVAQ